MNFADYTIKSRETLGYETNEQLIACCAMELAGEITEYIEQLNDFTATEESLKKELGDICYSLAMLPDYFGLSVHKIEDPYVGPNTPIASASSLVEDGLFCVGRLQEVLKKIIRDDNWGLSDLGRRDKFLYYLNSLYTYVLYECDLCGYNLSDILTMNVEKLADRKVRNKIKGDGDNR